jgi:hypothetical protein
MNALSLVAMRFFSLTCQIKKVISLEEKLEVLKDYIQAALYRKWLNNIVVGHIAVDHCNREGKLRSARGSNEGMQEIKEKS